MKNKKRVAILDTSAFIAGFDPFSIAEAQFTVPLVAAEIRAQATSNLRFSTAIESGKLRVLTPERVYLQRVSEQARFVGDAPILSPTDLDILALALQLKTQNLYPIVATDDYAIQNVANQIGIEFCSLGTLGIRKRWLWERYCPACRRRYPASTKPKECTVCGTKLKRKPGKKSRLSNQTLRKKWDESGLSPPLES